ncbi:MAG: ABC transporter permease [Dehalococcoidales bacterium]|nr:ABC transporter permease [Dehalococcoidales bacterium]
MKKFFDLFANGWMGVVTHKLRSFLAMLGIVIGVGAVIGLMSIGRGTEATIVSGVQGLGTNLLFITPGATTSGGVRTDFGSARTLTLEDAEAIQAEVPGIDAVAPYNSTGAQAVVKGQNSFARITGITPAYQDAFNLQVAEGDLINDYDYQTAQAVAVLGATQKTMLFGDTDAVGQTLRLGKLNVKVIGVLASKGQSIVGSVDQSVLVPLSYLQRTISQSRTTTGQHVVNSIVISVSDQTQSQAVIDAITSLLRYRHGIIANQDNDFTATSQQDIVNTLTSAINSLTYLLGAIAAISLLVGGIGVMNIMLVSVIERTREIGIRMALGASGWNIRIQFLIESALLTVVGGIVGVALGWGASRVLANVANVATIVSPDIIILAVSVSVGIGMFFGLYPAWQASRLNPIEALRSD